MKNAMPNWSSPRAVSQQEYDKAVTALRSAEADLHRAQETVNEVQATLDWATIRSPIDGTVIDKKVDVGDMVTPGQMLVTLFDPKRMQLVASVRESLDAPAPGRPEHRRAGRGAEQAVQRDGQRDRARGTIGQPQPSR